MKHALFDASGVSKKHVSGKQFIRSVALQKKPNVNDVLDLGTQKYTVTDNTSLPGALLVRPVFEDEEFEEDFICPTCRHKLAADDDYDPCNDDPGELNCPKCGSLLEYSAQTQTRFMVHLKSAPATHICTGGAWDTEAHARADGQSVAREGLVSPSYGEMVRKAVLAWIREVPETLPSRRHIELIEVAADMLDEKVPAIANCPNLLDDRERLDMYDMIFYGRPMRMIEDSELWTRPELESIKLSAVIKQVLRERMYPSGQPIGPDPDGNGLFSVLASAISAVDKASGILNATNE